MVTEVLGETKKEKKIPLSVFPLPRQSIHHPAVESRRVLAGEFNLLAEIFGQEQHEVAVAVVGVEARRVGEDGAFVGGGFGVRVGGYGKVEVES